MADSEFEEWFSHPDNYYFVTQIYKEKELARRAWNAALDLAQKEAQVELNHGADWFPDLLESHKVD